MLRCSTSIFASLCIPLEGIGCPYAQAQQTHPTRHRHGRSVFTRSIQFKSGHATGQREFQKRSNDSLSYVCYTDINTWILYFLCNGRKMSRSTMCDNAHRCLLPWSEDRVGRTKQWPHRLENELSSKVCSTRATGSRSSSSRESRAQQVVG